MTVQEYLNKHYWIENFIIITLVNWTTKILYDTAETTADLSNMLYDSIIESVYTDDNGVTVIEI